MSAAAGLSPRGTPAGLRPVATGGAGANAAGAYVSTEPFLADSPGPGSPQVRQWALSWVLVLRCGKPQRLLHV